MCACVDFAILFLLYYTTTTTVSLPKSLEMPNL